MEAKKVIKKYYFYLTLLIFIIAIFIGIFIIINIKVPNYNEASLYYLILMVFFIAILLYFRQLLYSYNNLARIAKVILNQDKPLRYKKNPIIHKDYFIKNNFDTFTNNENYIIYYKNEPNRVLKFKKINIITLILILKKNDLDFYDKTLHEDINKLEATFSKKEFPNKYVIAAFKEFNGINKEDLKSISEVVSYSRLKQTYVQINVGLNKADKLAYLLYSNSYYPSGYYKEAVDLIKDILL